MKSINNNFNSSPENSIPHPKGIDNSSEAVEYVSKFEHLKEDLANLFNIEVTSESSLKYPWVKDEMYYKVVEDFDEGKPFALDYMFEEGLLTKEDLKERNIQAMKPQAINILRTFKGPLLVSAKKLFINTGILNEEEATTALSS